MGLKESSVEDLGLGTRLSLNGESILQYEMIGVIPAARKATRISPLLSSKELYPIGLMPLGDGSRACPKVVCHYLLKRMRLAGITKAYIV